MKNLVKNTVVAAALGMACTGTYAYTITAGGTAVSGEGQYTSVSGAITENFNSGLLPAGYSGGAIEVGSASGLWAAPPLDASPYYSVGPSTSEPGAISLSSPTAYFGFYWGSPDSYNSVELWNGSTRVGTFSGIDLATRTAVTFGGDQSVGTYVNILAGNSGEWFNQVKFSSNGINAFETDNLAVAAAVPEPETYAMMLAGLGLMVLIARRRKLTAAA